MSYRRNADSHLRQIEREYQLSPRAETLAALNRELRRVGRALLTAKEEVVANKLLQVISSEFRVMERNVPLGITARRANTPTTLRLFEIAPSILEMPRPPTNQDIQKVKNQYQKLIPVIQDLGWLGIYWQCGHGITEVKLTQKKIEDRLGRVVGVTVWTVSVEEEGGPPDLRQIFHNKSDAIDYLLAVQSDVDNQRSYPSLYIFPQTIFEYSAIDVQTYNITMDDPSDLTFSPNALKIITTQIGLHGYQDPEDPTGHTDIAFILASTGKPSDRIFFTYECLLTGNHASFRKVHQFQTEEEAKADFLLRLLMLKRQQRCRVKLF